MKNLVHSIAIDLQGVKWFGTENGVTSFDDSNGMTWKTYTKADGLASNIVYTIAIDSKGVKWFGTYEGGVTRYDGTTMKTYTNEYGLANNSVSFIKIDANDVKWIGTYDGLSRFDGITWKTYKASDGLGDNHIFSIAIDSLGVKWFGTEGGVSKFEDQAPTFVSDSRDQNHPGTFGIRAAYPNPFNPSTTIDFLLPYQVKAKLAVYSITGQLVETLIDGIMNAGSHQVAWNASPYSSGVYLVVLESEGRKDSRKVVFMK